MTPNRNRKPQDASKQTGRTKMPKKLPGLTTGEVRGQLGISESALMRYVKEFRENFSDPVAKKRLGRRWTSRDINTLLVIRSMKLKRAKREEIVRALSNGITFEQESPAVSTAMMIEISIRNLQQMEKLAAEVRTLAMAAKWNDKDYINIVKFMKDRFKWYDRAIRKLSFQITLIEFYLKNPLRRYPVAKRFHPVMDKIYKVLDNWLHVEDEEMQYVGAMMRDLDDRL